MSTHKLFKNGGIFLHEENVEVQFEETVDHFVELTLLVQEGLVEEFAKDLLVLLRAFMDEVFELFLLKHIPEQCMEVDEIVCEGGLDVSFCESLATFGYHWFKSFIPTFTELLLIQETFAIFMDSHVDVKGGGIPTYSHLLLDLSHAPLELGALFEFEVGADQLVKDLTDGLQLLSQLLRVELEGVVHDAAVVESKHFEVGQRVPVRVLHRYIQQKILKSQQDEVINKLHEILRIAQQLKIF